MNDEIIGNYECDLEFFIRLAAQDSIAKNMATNDCEENITAGSVLALKCAAIKMLYRLSSLAPKNYSFLDYGAREKYIDKRIDQYIKEKADDKDKS